MADEDEKPTGWIAWLLAHMKSFAVALVTEQHNRLILEMPGLSTGIMEHIKAWLGDREASQWQAMINQFVQAGMIDESAAAHLFQMKDQTFPVDTLAYFYLYFALSMGYVSLTAEASSGKIRQDLNKLYSPTPLAAQNAILASFIAPEKTGEARDAMRRTGLSDEDIDLMFISNYRLYNEQEIRNLWLRGVLSENQMFMRMRELGYTDTRIKELVQGWPLIPGPQDIITMVAKEAFEPDMINKMGLADEFPEEQVEWLNKQGLSREWAMRYWYSHWDQPSIGMGYEMLHRGVIDLDTLDMLYRVVEIPPYWRDKLTKIAYNPYTRVDVRRMHKIGVLDDAQLLQAYKDLGFDEEKATNMVNFTIEYNLGSEKSVTRGEIITGYREKLVDHDAAIDLLIETRYTKEHAEYLLVLEDYKEAKELQDMAIKNIQTRFQNNMLEAWDARGKLGELNLSALKVDSLINKWELDRFVDNKLFSKTDLQKLFLNKIISEDQWRSEMYKLGYGWQYIDWAWQLMGIKKPVT